MVGRALTKRFVFLWLGVFLLTTPFADAFSREDTALHTQWAETLNRIQSTVEVLRKKLHKAGIEIDLTQYDEVWRKIGPQATLLNRPLIMTALGGHNTGKSTLINTIVGSTGEDSVTVVSSKGGETTLPVALISNQLPTKDLSSLFAGFELVQWKRAEDASVVLQQEQPRLLWKKHARIPQELVILDTPDVDSYHRENGERTRQTIKASDVVLVVLSEGYANDHVFDVLQEVGRSNKPVIFVFNKSEIKDDYIDKIWSRQLKELREKAKLDVVGAFAIERNRGKAREGKLLDFYAIGKEGTAEPQIVNPVEAIGDLELHKMRIQSELGSLQLALTGETGLDQFLAQVGSVHAILDQFQRMFADEESETKTYSWELMPKDVIKQAVLDTWAHHNRSWTTTGIKMAPQYLMKAIGMPFRYRYQVYKEKQEQKYRELEFAYLHKNVLNLLLTKLEEIKSSDLLSGKARAILEEKLRSDNVAVMQEKLRKAHDSMKLVDGELSSAIRKEFDRIRVEEPDKYKAFQNGDAVLAGLEFLSTFTVSLGAGRLVAAPLLANFFTSFFAGFAQTGGAIATAGGASVGSSVLFDYGRTAVLSGPCKRILDTYAEGRLAWVMKWIEENYLKEFYAAMREGIRATQAPEVEELRTLVDCARKLGDQVTK